MYCLYDVNVDISEYLDTVVFQIDFMPNIESGMVYSHERDKLTITGQGYSEQIIRIFYTQSWIVQYI